MWEAGQRALFVPRQRSGGLAWNIPNPLNSCSFRDCGADRHRSGCLGLCYSTRSDPRALKRGSVGRSIRGVPDCMPTVTVNFGGSRKDWPAVASRRSPSFQDSLRAGSMPFGERNVESLSQLVKQSPARIPHRQPDMFAGLIAIGGPASPPGPEVGASPASSGSSGSSAAPTRPRRHPSRSDSHVGAAGGLEHLSAAAWQTAVPNSAGFATNGSENHEANAGKCDSGRRVARGHRRWPETVRP